jgi:hypothetical protein
MIVLENKARSGIFEPKREDVAGGWKRLYIMRNFTFCTPLQILLG